MRKSLKLISIALAAVLAVCFLAACGNTTDINGDVDAPSTEEPTQAPDVGNESYESENETYIKASEHFSNFDTRISYENAIQIVLKDGASTCDGEGVTIDGDVITIGKGGSYVLSGDLSDGQIIVCVEKTEKVQLVLKGVQITSKTSSAIYIQSADKVAITLEKDTENILSDAAEYTGLNEKSEPSACIFSKDDLTINGYGKLVVYGNYKNGITTKNDFKMVSGNVTVYAKNNGIKGKDSVLINSGTLLVDSDDDAVKVTEDEDAEKGFILIEGGVITLKAGDDSLTAVTSVTITGGSIVSYALGKAINCAGNISVASGCLKEM